MNIIATYHCKRITARGSSLPCANLAHNEQFVKSLGNHGPASRFPHDYIWHETLLAYYCISRARRRPGITLSGWTSGQTRALLIVANAALRKLRVRHGYRPCSCPVARSSGTNELSELIFACLEPLISSATKSLIIFRCTAITDWKNRYLRCVVATKDSSNLP